MARSPSHRSHPPLPLMADVFFGVFVVSLPRTTHFIHDQGWCDRKAVLRGSSKSLKGAWVVFVIFRILLSAYLGSGPEHEQPLKNPKKERLRTGSKQNT